MDWIITLPKSVPWDHWLLEVTFARENRMVLNYRLPHKINYKPGEKCFIVHDGFVKGYTLITEVVDHTKGFTCTFTGNEWRPGYYLQREPKFYPLEKVIPMKGFRGVRRFNAEVR